MDAQLQEFAIEVLRVMGLDGCDAYDRLELIAQAAESSGVATNKPGEKDGDGWLTPVAAVEAAA